ncbi:hypothetical protein ACHAWF_016391 [Thalassiosira exigua]
MKAFLAASLVLSAAVGGGLAFSPSSPASIGPPPSTGASDAARRRGSTALSLKRIFDPTSWNYSTDFLDSRSGRERRDNDRYGYDDYNRGGDYNYRDDYDPYYRDGNDGRRDDSRRSNGIIDPSYRDSNRRRNDYRDGFERGNYRDYGRSDRDMRRRDLQYLSSPSFRDEYQTSGGGGNNWRGSEDFRRTNNRGGSRNVGNKDEIRWGWQQTYNTGRGNVRNGSSSDFRRGRSYNTYRTYATPREREMRQMEDNRRLGRGGYNGGRDGMGGQMEERLGTYYGRNKYNGYGESGVDYGYDSLDDFGYGGYDDRRGPRR